MYTTRRTRAARAHGAARARDEGDIKARCGDDLKLLHCQFLTVSSAVMLFAATVVVGLLLSPGGNSVLTASFMFLDSVVRYTP